MPWAPCPFVARAAQASPAAMMTRPTTREFHLYLRREMPCCDIASLPLSRLADKHTVDQALCRARRLPGECIFQERRGDLDRFLERVSLDRNRGDESAGVGWLKVERAPGVFGRDRLEHLIAADQVRFDRPGRGLRGIDRDHSDERSRQRSVRHVGDSHTSVCRRSD